VHSRRQFLASSFAIVASPAGTARPKQVLVIRHAEKTGAKNDANLNPRGYERAAALPRLFPSQFDTPAFIFASRISRHSNRPIETVTPLGKSLKLAIDSRFGDQEYAALARELFSNARYYGATALVCWHHDAIPALAKALGVTHPPARWPDKRFDRVWKIEYAGDAVTFTDAPQRLLSGDS
jgi:broad specificity phosphatase PhoE